MKRFGFAIRTGGDPEISRALAEGIERGTTEASSVTGCAVPPDARMLAKAYGPPKREGLGEHCSVAVRRVAMMRHTPQEWARMTEDARVFYGGSNYTPRWIERLLIGWTIIWMGVSWLYHQQDRLLNRRAL